MAAAVRDFSAALEPLSPVARPGRLRDAAPALRDARDRAAVAAQRLAAARLEDQRLERQRERVAAAAEPALAAMDRVVAAAEAGDARQAAAAATGFATAVDRLRASALPT